MAQNQSIRVRADILVDDEEAYIAVQGIENYQPANPAYNKPALTAKMEAMRAAQQALIQAEQTLVTVRDVCTAAEWELHNAMLGVKDQVVAQFGPDSNEAQSLGLKKKSDRARPARKPVAA